MADVELAKDRIDVGLYTNRYEEMASFYGGVVGLPYEELLKVGGGVHQHRYGLRGSVCKINAARADLPPAPTAFRRLVVAREGVVSPEVLVDPDGTEVELVPPGHEGVDDLAVEWVTGDVAGLARLLADGFGAVDGRIGTSSLRIVHDPSVPEIGGMFARGLRYLTVQVRDVKAAHAHLLDVGWSEGRAPVKLGETAYISFVRDAGGSWIEVSQRASLTGPLPD
ncbi:MAG TPA: VOC family protein [Acidimicrobiales bacterium]|nr:VOC family protein [Acidimicrobiales bacterium]